MGDGQDQQMAPVPQVAQTPLAPDIVKRQQDLIRQQQGQAVPTSHLAEPKVNASFMVQKPGEALKSMVPIMGQSLQEAAKAKKQAEVDKYTTIFQQLDSEWTKAQQMAGGDPKKAEELYKASPTYKSVFNAHDPKAYKNLKEMQQVFIAPWLDDGGESSPAVAGYKRHMQIKSATDQAQKVQQLQSQFDQMRQNQPSQTDPKAIQGLNETVRSTTGIALEQTREQNAQSARVQFSKDANGNMVSINKATGMATPVMIDYGKGPEPLKGNVTGKNGALVVDGVPVGVYKNGQALQPGDPNWTGEDQRHLSVYQEGYKVQQANMDHRTQLSAQARAEAFASYRPVGLIDDEGNLFETTAEFLKQHPGEYAPAGEGVKARNRGAIFDEITYTAGQVNKSIAELPDEPFDVGTRAQLAAALRAEDPKSAMDGFLHSTLADTLTDSQVKYVTGLASLAESGMGLKTVAGLGQGSDMVRGAIQKMLPGPGTPGKAYAKRQMELFMGEVNALQKKSVPKIGNKSMGGKSMSLDDTLDTVFGKKQ